MQKIHVLCYRVALKINAHLNQQSQENIQHIPRIPHARKKELPKELAIPAEEVHLLVQRMQRKAPGPTSQMRGKVLRLLKRGDQRTYYEWLQAQQMRGTYYSRARMENRWSGFLTLPMADKRHRANQVREALGRQIIPWTFGLPRNEDNEAKGTSSTHGADKQRKKRRKRTQKYAIEETSTTGMSLNPIGRHTEPEIT